MTWFKIDDSFYDHPKVFDAPDSAVALWTRAGTWSARNLTEGFVPAGLPARLCGDPDTAVKELVRRGLWLRTAGGFQFHDWASYQPSREAVEDLRAKRAAAGKLGGRARAAKQHGKQTPATGEASATGVAKQNPAPSRPDPPPSKEGGEGASRRADARGATATPPAAPPPPVTQRPSTAAAPPADLIAEAKAKIAAASHKHRAAGDARQRGAFEELMAVPTASVPGPDPDAEPPPTDTDRET